MNQRVCQSTRASNAVHLAETPIVRIRPPVKQQDNEKRRATYFPSKESFDTKWNFTDDTSTWEFSAPAARNSSLDSSSSTSSSPAQEIVIRYRAGMSLEAILKGLGCAAASSSGLDSGKSSLDPTSIASKHELPLSEQELKPIYRQSRCDAQIHALQEAVTVMQNDGLRENENIVCHRRGCRDTISNVKGLMYHLHIHNVHDQTFKCGLCEKRFDGPLQMGLHRCASRDPQFRSPPTSPVKEGFFRVVAKVTRFS